MKRIILFLFMIPAFFICLSSCGIPYIYEVSSADYSITRDQINSTVVVSLENNFLSGDLENNGDYPKLHLLYIVEPSGYSSSTSQVIKAFNTKYTGTQKSVRIPITDFLATYSSNNIDYTISELQELNNTKLDRTLLDSDDSWKLQFSINSDNLLEVMVNDDPSLTFTYGRYFDGEDETPASFDSLNDYFGNELDSELKTKLSTTDFTVRIYAVVAFDFRNYTNNFNTQATLVYEFDNADLN